MPTRRAPRRTRRQKQDAQVGEARRVVSKLSNCLGSAAVFGSTDARDALFEELLDKVNAFRSRSLPASTWERGGQSRLRGRVHPGPGVLGGVVWATSQAQTRALKECAKAYTDVVWEGRHKTAVYDRDGARFLFSKSSKYAMIYMLTVPRTGPRASPELARQRVLLCAELRAETERVASLRLCNACCVRRRADAKWIVSGLTRTFVCAGCVLPDDAEEALLCEAIDDDSKSFGRYCSRKCQRAAWLGKTTPTLFGLTQAHMHVCPRFDLIEACPDRTAEQRRALGANALSVNAGWCL